MFVSTGTVSRINKAAKSANQNAARYAEIALRLYILAVSKHNQWNVNIGDLDFLA